MYAPFGVLAAVYQLALGSPSAYTLVHLVASASHGVGATVIIGAVAWDLATTRSPLVRRRIGVVALGTLGAFALPGGLMAASAILGGQVALNAGAFTAFVFPLSLGYAIVTQDLFEIDVVLRRAAIYAATLVTITTAYLAVLALVGTLVPLQSLSPVTMAALNLAILLLIAPIKARVQDAVDRLFYRQGYVAEQALSALSATLSPARTIGDVAAQTRTILGAAMHPESARLWLTNDGATFVLAADTSSETTTVALPQTFVTQLAAGTIVARYRWEEHDAAPPPFWQTLDAELLVPIRSGAFVIGALTLGRKESGRAYNERDTAFLAAAASQVGLAITNANAFSQLAELNAGLEDQVRERTAALEIANRDLNRSYTTMQSAFRQLEQSQASLMRADRLATLGRLAASVAHEVNTPLGAVLNALQTLGNLGREYGESIDDADVSPEDHREIAGEIVATANAATGWARKAATFISQVKNHGREPHPGLRRPFAVATVVDETRALLAQRIRLESCTVDLDLEPRDLALVGDPARLGQVLVNLVSNALDAYEERHSIESRIAIRGRRRGDTVEIVVEDWAGGIPPEITARIFDELFTTKDAGRGTGLGLCIARNVIEQSFEGTLTVESTVGVGSRFVIAVPMVDVAAAVADAAVALS
jgi:signal transduction histidine kinase